MREKKRMRNWVKLVIGLFILAILFANPTTRMIIKILLPLGSGVDDAIEIVAIIIALTILVHKLVYDWDSVKRWFEN